MDGAERARRLEYDGEERVRSVEEKEVMREFQRMEVRERSGE